MSYTKLLDLKWGEQGEPADQILFLQVSREGLQVLVTTALRQPVLFQRIEFDKDSVEDDSVAALAAWLNEQREFTRQWARLVIVHDCEQVVLIPAALYNVDNGKELLDVQYGDLFKGTMLTEQVNGRQDYTVYRISTDAFHHLATANVMTQHRHLISLWLEWLDKIPAYQDGEIFILFQSSRIYLAVRKKEWQVVQQYEYQQPEDISYYLLSALEQSGLDPATVQLYYNGWINTDSSLYNELNKYINDIHLAPVPNGLLLPEDKLGDEPAHYFTPLIQMASCAL
ncbi:MAG TPA: DUF3822 family protein [Flavihumibacter sp.]|nr:DUF3822 family protein [Flavihumibacter sp.]